MTAPQDPFRAPDPGEGPPPYGPPPGAPGVGGPPAGPAASGAWGAYGGGPGGGYGSAPVRKRNGFGVAALVLGILALLTSVLLGGIPFGIAAVVFGVLGRGRAKRGEADNGGLALAGIVLGALGLLLSIGVIAAGASFLSQNSGSFRDLTACLQEAQGDPDAQAECQAQFEDDVTG